MKNQVLVLTHGEMAKGVNVSLRVITGEENAIDFMCVMEADAPETVKHNISEWLSKQDNSKPIVIVTDIPFGSTTVLATPFIAEYSNLHIVTGLNLAMMIAMITTELKNDTVSDTLKTIIEDSKTMVSYINDCLTSNDEEENF